MQQLIKKELLLQKKKFLFGLCYSVFLFIVFSTSPAFQEFTYTMAAFGISYITIIGIVQAEYKNNNDIVINSLPTTRQEVVAAKYLSTAACIVIALVIVAIVGLVFHQFPPPFNYRLINGLDIAATVASVFLFSALSLPMYFKAQAQWLRAVNLVIFFLIFFAAEYLVENKQESWIQNLGHLAAEQTGLLSLAGITGMLAILFISYSMALHIYRKKEF